MSQPEYHYFKFVSALIDTGIWAQMSPAARALYPVLMRFSDRNFKPVYPGSTKLLKLTGFKQKSSIRKAREELVQLGLITLTRGTGRTNTTYQFRFDWIPQGGSLTPRWGGLENPPGVVSHDPQGGRGGVPGGLCENPQYNQIHISINNKAEGEGGQTNAAENERRRVMIRRFGKRAVELAESECRLGGMESSMGNVQKILYRAGTESEDNWGEVKRFLEARISPASLRMIEDAFITDRDGVLIFRDNLPPRLKELLMQTTRNIFFEPPDEEFASRLDFWAGIGEGL